MHFFTFMIVFLYTASNILILCIGSFCAIENADFSIKSISYWSLTLVRIVIFFIFPGYFVQYITLHTPPAGPDILKYLEVDGRRR